MASNPINLAIRFLLEMSALIAVGLWGWEETEGWHRFLLGFGLPVLLMAIWGTFAVPNDPSRSGSAPVRTPGLIRLLIELSFFAVGSLALYDMQMISLSWVFTTIVVVHYAVSYDRILWLLRR
jgi:hypothetical protein